MSIRELHAYSESDIYSAVAAYHSKKYKSIRACAHAFGIPYTTFQGRVAGRISRSRSHYSMLILSIAEEKTLVRWITNLTSTGFPATPALAIEMAKEIRRARYQLSTQPNYLRPIGKSWLDRFRKRHPEIQGIQARTIEGVRHKAVTPTAVNT